MFKPHKFTRYNSYYGINILPNTKIVYFKELVMYKTYLITDINLNYDQIYF